MISQGRCCWHVPAFSMISTSFLSVFGWFSGAAWLWRAELSAQQNRRSAKIQKHLDFCISNTCPTIILPKVGRGREGREGRGGRVGREGGEDRARTFYDV